MSDRISLPRPAALVPLAGVVAIVLAVALLGGAGSAAFQRTTQNVLLDLVLVVGLYVFVGNSGVLSFGHIAFAAIGAYTTALVTIPHELKAATLPELPGFIADAQLGTTAGLLAGGALAALVAAVVAVPLMRLSGIAASIATLSVLVIVNVVASNWDDVTNGTGTLVGIPTNEDLWTVVPWALAALIAAFAFQQSRAGSRLRATREDAVAAQSVGISVARERRVAFVLSAFLVGVGGGLYARFLGAFNPDQFYLDLTFLTIAMLVIGGLRSLSGAVVGVVFVSAVSEALRELQEGGIGDRAGLREFVLASIMLAVLVFRPDGLTGGRELRWPRRRRDLQPAVPGRESGPVIGIASTRPDVQRATPRPGAPANARGDLS